MRLTSTQTSPSSLARISRSSNKIWNIARYVFKKIGDEKIPDAAPSASHDILEKLDATALGVTESIEGLRFGEAAHLLYDFVWHDFADRYVEETKEKDDANTKHILAHVFGTSLKLLHPFMPFITEALWQEFRTRDGAKEIKDTEGLLMVEPWPR